MTKKNVHENTLINGTDIFATVSQIAGANMADITTAKDSMSFRSTLTSEDNKAHKRSFLFTEWAPARGPTRDAWTIRDDRYKVIVNSNGTKELYDLLSDPYENNNLMRSSLSSDLQTELDKLLEYEKSLR